MTSRYSARIRVDAGDRAPAILAAVGADARFHPESGQDAVRVSAGAAPGGAGAGAAQSVGIDIGADQLPHLRAGVNSTLRLVQAAYESIGAAAAEPAAGGRGAGRAGRRAGRAAPDARARGPRAARGAAGRAGRAAGRR